MRKLAIVTAAAALVFAFGSAALADDDGFAVIVKCTEIISVDPTTAFPPTVEIEAPRVVRVIASGDVSSLQDTSSVPFGPCVERKDIGFTNPGPTGPTNTCVQCLAALVEEFDCKGGAGVTSEGAGLPLTPLTVAEDFLVVNKHVLLECEADD